MTVTIKGTTFGANTLAGLQTLVRTWIDVNDYGASDIGGRWRIVGHPEACYLSYNGRIWTRSGNELKAA